MPFPKGRAHGDNRLARENHSPLGHGFYVTRKTEIRKRGQELFAEYSERTEIGYVRLGKVQIADIFRHLLQSRRHGVGVSAASAVEKVERGATVVHSALEISVRHRELIQVGEHSEVTLAADRKGHFFSSVFSEGADPSVAPETLSHVSAAQRLPLIFHGVRCLTI